MGGIHATGGTAPGEQLHEDHAKGEDISRDRAGFPGATLGGSIGRREVAQGRRGVVGVQAGRDPEVEQAHASLARDQDVRGLEVAVHDESLVRGPHGQANVAEQLHAMADARGCRRAVPGDGRAVHMLHGKPRRAVVGLPGVVQRDDAGMAQRGEDALLLVEASAAERGERSVPQHLQRDLGADVVASCEVHDAHATITERADDAVGAERRRGKFGWPRGREEHGDLRREPIVERHRGFDGDQLLDRGDHLRWGPARRQS